MAEINRRAILAGASAATACLGLPARARTTFRLGLTPGFLDNDAIVIDAIQ